MITLIVLLILLAPSIAFGSELIPPLTPPPDTNWYALVGTGAGIVVGIVAAIRHEVPKIDGRLVYALVLPVSVGVALWQVGVSDAILLAKHSGYVFVWAIGGTAGLKVFIGWAARSLYALVNRDTLPPEPGVKGPPAPPPLPPVLPVITLCFALLGCGVTPLQSAIITADAMADSANVAAPILKEQCVEPMQAAAIAGDKSKGQEVAAKCNAPVAAYAVLQVTHVALSAVIVKCAAGDCKDLQTTLVTATTAAAKLAAEIGKVTQ